MYFAGFMISNTGEQDCYGEQQLFLLLAVMLFWKPIEKNLTSQVLLFYLTD